MTWNSNTSITPNGYACDLPPGKYYLGDPKQMLIPSAYETIGAVKEGIIYDQEKSSFIFVAEFTHTNFAVEVHTEYWVNFYSPDGFAAIMSENIVKEDEKIEDLLLETSLPLRVISSATKLFMFNNQMRVTIYEPICPDDHETSDQERDRLSGGYYSRY
jgi:hypothetical protein